MFERFVRFHRQQNVEQLQVAFFWFYWNCKRQWQRWYRRASFLHIPEDMKSEGLWLTSSQGQQNWKLWVILGFVQMISFSLQLLSSLDMLWPLNLLTIKIFRAASRKVFHSLRGFSISSNPRMCLSLAMDKVLMLEGLGIPRMEILPCVDIHCCVFPIATGPMAGVCWMR